jgi:2-keto-3-deoxy-L-rhamnonate aldolase RhmA
MGSRFKEILAAGQRPAGVLMVTPGGETVQTLGAAGFDFIMIDMLYGTIDWSEAADMTRAARLAGMTPLARIPSEPGIIRDNADLLANVAGRALSVGCQGVVFSIGGVEDLETVTKIALGSHCWHREMHTIRWDTETFAGVVDGFREETVIGVTLEAVSAIEELERIVQVPGLTFVTVATTDLALTLGNSVDSESAPILEMLDRVTSLCRKHGIAVAANTGMAYSDLDKMRARADQLMDVGVDIIMYQTSSLILQGAGRYVLSGLKARNAASVQAPGASSLPE